MTDMALNPWEKWHPLRQWRRSGTPADSIKGPTDPGNAFDAKREDVVPAVQRASLFAALEEHA